jgi:hypothetical protein
MQQPVFNDLEALILPLIHNLCAWLHLVTTLTTVGSGAQRSS